MYGGPNLSTRTRILENAFAFGLGADREYQPGQQEALFVSEIFENLTSSAGLLAVDCQSPVAMVGAIQDSNGAIVLTPANPD